MWVAAEILLNIRQPWAGLSAAMQVLDAWDDAVSDELFDGEGPKKNLKSRFRSTIEGCLRRLGLMNNSALKATRLNNHYV